MTNPWPNSAVHRCTSLLRLEEDIVRDPHKRDTGEWYDIFMNKLLQEKRSADNIRLLVKESKEVIKLCGQDPLRVTAAEMDALDPRIQWDWKARVSCSSIMGWRQAVSSVVSSFRSGLIQGCVQIAEKHRQRSPHRGFSFSDPPDTVGWSLFPQKHRENLARFEIAAKAAAENHKAKTRRWDCVHCCVRVHGETNQEIIQHVKTK